MSDLGFSWDFQPKFSSESTTTTTTTTKTTPKKINNPQITRKFKKRLREDDSVIYKPLTHPSNRRVLTPIIKNSGKRIKSNEIPSGRSLPLNRAIELLDKRQLTNLLMGLIDEKPELNQIIQTNVGKFGSFINPNVEKSLSYLENFLNDLILKKLPYKVEPESEYSFLRINKSLAEFYMILSDFILNFLPPKELNFINCLKFLDGVTQLISRIPKFKISQGNLYHFINIYDQLANAWWSVFKYFTTSNLLTVSENDLNVFQMIDFNLLEKLKLHQQSSNCDKLDGVLEFVESRINNYNLNNIQIDNGNSIVHDLFNTNQNSFVGFNNNNQPMDFSGKNHPVKNQPNYNILDSSLH